MQHSEYKTKHTFQSFSAAPIGLALTRLRKQSTSIMSSSRTTTQDSPVDYAIMHYRVDARLFDVVVDNTLHPREIAQVLNIDSSAIDYQAKHSSETKYKRRRYNYYARTSRATMHRELDFLQRVSIKLSKLKLETQEEGADTTSSHLQCEWSSLNRRKEAIKVFADDKIIQRGYGGVYGCVGLNAGCSGVSPFKTACYYMEIDADGDGGICLGLASCDSYADRRFMGGLIGASHESVGFHCSGSLVEMTGEWVEYGRRWGCGDVVGMLLRVVVGDKVRNGHIDEGELELSDAHSTSDDESETESAAKSRRSCSPRRKRSTFAEVTFFVNGKACETFQDESLNEGLRKGKQLFPAVSIYREGTEVRYSCCPKQWAYSQAVSETLNSTLTPFCSTYPRGSCLKPAALNESHVTPQ